MPGVWLKTWIFEVCLFYVFSINPKVEYCCLLDWWQHQYLCRVDSAFICLGTTRAKAGAEGFVKVLLEITSKYDGAWKEFDILMKVQKTGWLWLCGWGFKTSSQFWLPRPTLGVKPGFYRRSNGMSLSILSNAILLSTGNHHLFFGRKKLLLQQKRPEFWSGGQCQPSIPQPERAKNLNVPNTGCFFFNWSPPKSYKCHCVRLHSKSHQKSVRLYLPDDT